MLLSAMNPHVSSADLSGVRSKDPMSRRYVGILKYLLIIGCIFFFSIYLCAFCKTVANLYSNHPFKFLEDLRHHFSPQIGRPHRFLYLPPWFPWQEADLDPRSPKLAWKRWQWSAARSSTSAEDHDENAQSPPLVSFRPAGLEGWENFNASLAWTLANCFIWVCIVMNICSSKPQVFAYHIGKRGQRLNKTIRKTCEVFTAFET